MHIEQFGDFCLAKKGATEHFPFNEDVLVFKVMQKIFVLTSLDSWENGLPKINLKCNPDKAQQLREAYEGVVKGYHMHKKLWNTVSINTSDVADNLVYELINHSYEMVVIGLTNKAKNKLKNL